MKILRKIPFLAAAAAILFWLFKAFQPVPVRVEIGAIRRGPLEVLIEEDGETRAHDRFVISAPVAGRLQRLELHEGDRITAGQTAAIIHPVPLDPAARKEVSAKLQAAESLEREAQERVTQALTSLEQTRRDRKRAEYLASNGDISLQALEQARLAESNANASLEAARFRRQATASEVKIAQATVESQDIASAKPVPVISPVSGRILRIPEKSERVVPAGTPLLTLGDAHKLEIVIDVLSTDAVKIKPGLPVRLVNWGGDNPIRAHVRTIEPAAFTKISALGVEEQRVNIIAAFNDPPGPLGDAYRVEAQIVLWSSPDVLKAPASALFRCGDGWCVFTISANRARRTPIQLGHRSAQEAEILSGLQLGDPVILHPSNLIADSTLVSAAP